MSRRNSQFVTQTQMVDSNPTTLGAGGARTTTTSLKRPIQFVGKGGATAVRINQSGAMFRKAPASNSKKLVWIHSSKSPMEIDVGETETETSSSSRCYSSSLSSRFSSDNDLLGSCELDTGESSTTGTTTIQGPLATPRTRPILKKNPTESQPKCNTRKKKKKTRETSFQRTRSVYMDDDHDADTDTSTTSTASMDASDKKHVCFGTVAIRSYQQTLGDNPAVSYGPPIQLDWEYEEHAEIEIVAYESQKCSRHKRNLRQLTLSYYKRKNLLGLYGIEKEELTRAKKEANKTKFLRSVTTALLPICKVEEAMESVGRKAKRIIRRTSRRGKKE